ncbi:hypothetical protein NMY22_g6007 [Coprinellus aureogranulatus]|nr:hypothetical protein NMY22_g6007 [Coprinellus aureogranulatus]
MVMKQKKKTTKDSTNQASTLLDFFQAKTSSTPSNTPKSKHRDNSTKRKPLASLSREVIIIDSDSDSDEVEVVSVSVGSGKRRKLSPNSSNAQVSSASSVKLEDTLSEHDGLNSIAGPSSNNKSSSSSSSTLAFGSPFLLEAGPLSSEGTRKADPNISSPLPGPSRPAPFPLQRRRGDGSNGHSAGIESSCLEDTPGAGHSSRESGLLDADCSNVNTPTLDSPVKPELNASNDIDMTLNFWEEGDDEYGDDVTMGPPPDDVDTPDQEQEETQKEPYDLKPTNAFSMIMSGFKDDLAWKEADVAEDRSFRPTKSNRRKAPFYKVLQGMPIAVDAFRYGSIPGVTAYFLTHAHSDHYTNLSSSWRHGPIYCSEGTANLIVHMLSVDKKWVKPLPMDTPVTIPDSGGVQVTLIEANHCPGSCLFYFEGRQTVNAGDGTFKSPHIGSSRVFRYLHCGDFRASPRHVLHPAVKGKWIDHVYLDTTYLDPKYTFPPQAQVVSACADLATKLASGHPVAGKASGVFSWLTSSTSNGPSSKSTKEPSKPVLFVVGTYSIGKERIVKGTSFPHLLTHPSLTPYAAVAKALSTKVYCDKRKASLLRCEADAELDALLTSNPKEAAVHLLPLGMITSDKLPTYFDKYKDQFSKVVGFRPTGWTYVQPSGTDQLPSVQTILTRTVQKTFTCESMKPGKQSTSTMQLYPVPYSEHSSFYELTCFALSLKWGKMIATVNVGSEKSRAKMAKWVAKWEAERKKRSEEVVAHRHLDYW